MIDVVLARGKLPNIQRLARIEALSSLHEIKRQAFVEISIVARAINKITRDVSIPELRRFFLQSSHCLFECIISAFCPLAALLRVIFARDLDKDVFGRVSGDMHDFLDDGECLVDATAKRR